MEKGQLNGLEEAAALQQLRDILLSDDRTEVDRLRQLLNNEEKLEQHLRPILERRVEQFKQQFPKEYTAVVNRLIEEKIRSSQNEIVDAIFPLLGSMIKKYIDHQIQLLKDGIDAQIAATRKKLDFWGRLKARFAEKGPSEADLILAAAAPKTVLAELFLIEKPSGLLISHAAREQVADREAVAGMLTAIKSFAEDAFQKGTERLGFVEHEQTKIVLFDQPNFYVAAVLRGPLSTAERGQLEKWLEEFLIFHAAELKKRNSEPGFSEKFGQEMHRTFFLTAGRPAEKAV